MFVIASLDEVCITALLDRLVEAIVAEASLRVFVYRLLQASRAVVAVGLLLDLVVVVGNGCDTTTLTILVLFELASGERLPDDTTGTIYLVGTVLYVEALLAHHMTRCV